MRINGRKIKTIVSDFDGTIIKHGMLVPPRRFYELVNECLDKDIFFVAASGRQYQNLYRLLSGLNKEIAYIAENGSLVMYQGQVVHEEIIEEPLARELLADMMQEEGDILVSGQYTTYMLDHNMDFINHLKKDVGNDITPVKDFYEVTEPMIKISISYPDGIPTEMAERFHAKYDELLQVVDAGNNWFDFNPKGCSKGQALLVLADKLKLDLENAVVFGDGENDIAMMKETAVSFAMDTAKPNVQANADFICSSVEDVLRYGLDQEQQLKQFAIQLALAAGRPGEEALFFWEALEKDTGILEEFEYFYINRDFLCKHRIAGYSVVDILVWQVDHFKAYLDRHFDVNRYDRDKLVYNSFEVLLKMRENPKLYTDKLQRETGTDFEGKY